MLELTAMKIELKKPAVSPAYQQEEDSIRYGYGRQMKTLSKLGKRMYVPQCCC